LANYDQIMFGLSTKLFQTFIIIPLLHYHDNLLHENRSTQYCLFQGDDYDIRLLYYVHNNDCSLCFFKAISAFR